MSPNQLCFTDAPPEEMHEPEYRPHATNPYVLQGHSYGIDPGVVSRAKQSPTGRRNVSTSEHTVTQAASVYENHEISPVTSSQADVRNEAPAIPPRRVKNPTAASDQDYLQMLGDEGIHMILPFL